MAEMTTPENPCCPVSARDARRMQRWFDRDGRETWVVWGEPLPPPSGRRWSKVIFRPSGTVAWMED